MQSARQKFTSHGGEWSISPADQDEEEEAAVDAFGLSLFATTPPARSPRSGSFHAPQRSENRISADERVPSTPERDGISSDDVKVMMEMGRSEGEARRCIAEDRARTVRADELEYAGRRDQLLSTSHHLEQPSLQLHSTSDASFAFAGSTPIAPLDPVTLLSTSPIGTDDFLHALQEIEKEGRVPRPFDAETNAELSASADPNWPSSSAGVILDRRGKEQIVRQRDRDRVARAALEGKELGDETRALFRRLDRAHMAANFNVVNSTNMEMEKALLDAQSPPPLSPSPRPPFSAQNKDYRPSAPSFPRRPADPPSSESADFRAETPIPASYPRSSGLRYEPPPTGSELYTVPPPPSFLTFGNKFLASDKYKGPLDTHWTEATGRVMDRSHLKTLHGDLVNDYGRVILSVIDSETERSTKTSNLSRISSSSASTALSERTVCSPSRRPPSDPLSAATIERAQLPTISKISLLRAQKDRPSRTALTEGALSSLLGDTGSGSSKLTSIEAWRSENSRKAGSEEDSKARPRGMNETAGVVRQMMWESFGIDLDREDGPSPPYQESDPATGRPLMNPHARFVPKEVIQLLRDFVRLGDLMPKLDVTRLPAEHRPSEPFPMTDTTVLSARIDAPAFHDPSQAPTVNRPPEAPPSPPTPVWRQTADILPPLQSATRRDDYFSDDSSKEVFSLAPEHPHEGETFHEPSTVDSADYARAVPTDKKRIQPRSRRRSGLDDQATALRRAERDRNWALLQDFTKEHGRLTDLLPTEGSRSFSTAHLSTLNALGRLIEGLGPLQTPQQTAQAAWAYSRSLDLDPAQVEPLTYMAKWHISQAQESPEHYVLHQQEALGCFRRLVELEPENGHFRLCLANSMLCQPVSPEKKLQHGQLVAEELMCAVERCPKVSDTRVAALFQLGKTMLRIAHELHDEDENKTIMFGHGLKGLEACKISLDELMATPEDQRAPRTFVTCPSPEYLADSIRLGKAEWSDFQQRRRYAQHEREPSRSATRPENDPPRLARSTNRSLPPLFDSPYLDTYAPPFFRTTSTPSPAQVPTQDPDFGDVVPNSKAESAVPATPLTRDPVAAGLQAHAMVDQAVREQRRSVQHALAHGPSRSPQSRIPSPRPRIPVELPRLPRTKPAQTQTDFGRHSTSPATPSRRRGSKTLRHASALIDNTILQLHSMLSLSQERDARRLASEASMMRDSLLLLLDDVLAESEERQQKSNELASALEGVLEELQSLPERITATAKLMHAHHETAPPKPPPVNPIHRSLGRLQRAKEAVKSLIVR